MDDLTRIFSQLDADSKRGVLDVLEYPNAEEFQLTPPEGRDDLDDATTNGSSIEIEIVEAVADAMYRLDRGKVRFENVPPGAENLEKKWS